MIDLRRVQMSLTDDNKLYIQATAVNEKGAVIFGLSNAVPKEAVEDTLKRLLADMERTQDHVANTEKFGEGHS